MLLFVCTGKKKLKYHFRGNLLGGTGYTLMHTYEQKFNLAMCCLCTCNVNKFPTVVAMLQPSSTICFIFEAPKHSAFPQSSPHGNALWGSLKAVRAQCNYLGLAVLETHILRY